MARRKSEVAEPEQHDHIEFGSPQHAAFLGLREAHDDDDIQYEGYALTDVTLYGPEATDRFLRGVLYQKVNQLLTTPKPVQSEDPFAPNYAVPLWEPQEDLRRVETE